MGIGRAVAAAGIVVTGIGLLSACDFDMTTERDSDSKDVTQSFTSVRFANDSGDVRIHTGGPPSVKREIHYADEKPDETFRVKNGVLELDSCDKPNCWIAYDVTVPEGTSVTGQLDSGTADITGASAVTVRASSGRVAVRDVSGEVNVEAHSGKVELSDIDGDVVAKAESGSIEADGVRGDLTLEAESGSVEAHDLGGAARVKSSSGHVELQLATAQDVTVDADSGNVEVTVPDGDYQVSTNADSGNVDSEIGNDPAGEHRLDLRTDSGNITVSAA